MLRSSRRPGPTLKGVGFRYTTPPAAPFSPVTTGAALFLPLFSPDRGFIM